jgi:hypothetical protein
MMLWVTLLIALLLSKELRDSIDQDLFVRYGESTYATDEKHRSPASTIAAQLIAALTAAWRAT